MSLLDRPEGRLAIALGIGLVIGAERERRKDDGPRRVPAGIRTFAIVGLLGGVICALGSTALLAVGAVIVGVAAIVAYALGERIDPGLTTELSLFLTYCLGALAFKEPLPALAGGLTAATLLAFRTKLHAAVRAVLSADELNDALLFGVAAVVILPLLPNRAIDSLGVVNPFRLWRLVVAFMALSALGHIAQRAIGPRYGLALAGFGSGFVSSAATIAAMGARARANPAVLSPAVAGAAASTIATLIQMAILVGAADAHLLTRLAWPLVVGGATALGYAVVQTLRAKGANSEPERGHAFKLGVTLGFGALVTVVSLLSTLSMRWLGQGGLLATTALAGLADTHSAAAAVASVSGAGQISTPIAGLGVLLALTTNTVTKAVLAVTSGTRGYAVRVILGLALVLGSIWAVFAVQALR